MNNVDKIRRKLACGELVLGMNVGLADPLVGEIAAEVGYDFIFIDMEHGSITIETALRQVIAVTGSETAAFIRAPWPDPVRIKPLIELYPAGIVVPMVCTAEDAAAAVAACKYPPKGVRGFGPCRGLRFGAIGVPEYLEHADDQTLVIVQIEHVKAVENLDAILATPGIDTVMIGPNDLSASMGMLGRTTEPPVIAMIEQIVARSREAGIPVGLAGCSRDAVASWCEKGVGWIMPDGDIPFIYAGAKASVDQLRTIGRKHARG